MSDIACNFCFQAGGHFGWCRFAEQAPTVDAAPVVHRITWFVYTGGNNADGTRERIRRTASMRGTWPGYDVVCSCGDESHTGGAVRSYIENAVYLHKTTGIPLGC